MSHFMVKMYTKQEYAEKLIDGKLYAARLGSFKTLKNDEERGDKYEGAAIINKNSMILNVWPVNLGHDITQRAVLNAKNVVGPFRFLLKHFDHLNIFSLSLFHFDDLNPFVSENKQTRTIHMQLPDTVLKLGNYAVVIANIPEFLKRVREAASLNNYSICFAPVEYYDPEIGVPYHLFDDKIPFSK